MVMVVQNCSYAYAEFEPTAALPMPMPSPSPPATPGHGQTHTNTSTHPYISPSRPLHEVISTWKYRYDTALKAPTNKTEPVLTTIRRLDRFIGGFTRARVSLLEGQHEFLLNLVARIMVNTVRSSGRDVIYVDGGNTLDPYLLTASCRLFRLDPERVLRQIQVARAFTVFQLDTLLTQNLEQILERVRPQLVLVSCMSELYLDRDVDWSEAKALFRSGFFKLQELTEEYNTTTILTDLGRDRSIHRFELARRLRQWLDPADRVSLKRPSAARLRFVKGTGEFLDYRPLPPYQWSLDDFCKDGELCG